VPVERRWLLKKEWGYGTGLHMFCCITFIFEIKGVGIGINLCSVICCPSVFARLTQSTFTAVAPEGTRKHLTLQTTSQLKALCNFPTATTLWNPNDAAFISKNYKSLRHRTDCSLLCQLYDTPLLCYLLCIVYMIVWFIVLWHYKIPSIRCINYV